MGVVWTISAQAGSGGDDVAARLAVAAGVPLLDRRTLALFAHELNPLVEDGEELERRVGGSLNLAALSVAMTTGSRRLPGAPTSPDAPRARARCGWRRSAPAMRDLRRRGVRRATRASVCDSRASARTPRLAHRELPA